MPGRAPRWLAALGRASIWHREAIPVAEGQTSRELKRVVLPVFDGLLIVMGYMAIAHGMPSFDIVHSNTISTVAGWTLLTGGATAFVGVAFPRLWVAEVVGKLLAVAVLGGYGGALWALVLEGNDARALVAGAFTALTVLPLWNLLRLGRERRARKPRRGRAWSG